MILLQNEHKRLQALSPKKLQAENPCARLMAEILQHKLRILELEREMDTFLALGYT
jgi:hypothetical protein